MTRVPVLFALLAFVSTAAAQRSLTLWVDPVRGDDARSGTSREQALRTVAEAWSRLPEQAASGARIYLTEGLHAGFTASRPHRGVSMEAAGDPGSAQIGPLDLSGSRDVVLRGLQVDALRCEGCESVVADRAALATGLGIEPSRLRMVIAGTGTASRTVQFTGTGSVNVSSPVPWLTVTGGSPLTLPGSVTVTANLTTPGVYNTSLIVGGPAIDGFLPVEVAVFTPGAMAQIFGDVPGGHPWVDYIYLLNRFAITVGCRAAPLNFCPGETVTQAQMAAFLIRAVAGEGFAYPIQPYFTDVPASNTLFSYIQKMRELNINPGCGNNQFCPNALVTRGQMAQYIIRALYGESFPYDNTPRFGDVPSSSALFPYVQKMYDLGITQGCTSGNYCPNDTVTREQMAAFLSRAFFRYGNLNSPVPTPPPPPPPPAPSSGPTLGGCPMFPADNIWNTAIDTLPVHARSTDWVNTIGASRTLKADFGSGLWNGGVIGIPYVIVPQGQAKVGITFEYDEDSDPGPYPIPPNPPIEGGGDRHILVLEQGVCKLWEVFAAQSNGNGTWSAGSGAVFNLNSNAPLRPSGWTSADAAGLPILHGLVRYDEVLGGEIKHAIRFTAPQTKREFVWPARHYASSLTGTQYPPMGARFRLKAGFDISTYAPRVQVILRAMKKYGIILADNGSAWYVNGAPDERWDNDELRQFARLVGSNFEAVDSSSLMIDVNSGAARQP
ncbi:MAG: S-layer homology domain-containing protein [Bryobacterales bacterium]|nr:S-layer homology domain-containing protein [Bryobacterales bacterium]